MIALRICVLGLVAGLALSDAAVGQTPLDTGRTWGLVGDWSLDCGRPASGQNLYISYRPQGGNLVYWDGTLTTSSVVQSAVRRQDGTIVVVVYVTWLQHTREIVYAKSADGRSIQAQSNRNIETGEYTVRDGRMVSNGNRMAWHVRCR